MNTESKEQGIIKGNNLIATFMEFPTTKKEVKFSGKIETINRTLRYYTSWEWLMPVVEKIEKLTTTDGRGEVNYIVSIEADSCIISVGGESEVVCCQAYDTGKAKIEVTWEAVLEFIKWLNK